MGAAIVLRHNFNVFVPNVPVRIFVLDANIGEMHLVVEVRQAVFTRPCCDLGLASIGSAIGVAIATIALVEKALVVTFQLAVQLHPLDARALMVQAVGCLEVRPIELRVESTLTRSICA
jgi:hypothetical protein